MIEVAVHADRAEDGLRFAGGAMHVEAAGDKPINDVLDLRVGRAFLHYDDHGLNHSLHFARSLKNGRSDFLEYISGFSASGISPAISGLAMAFSVPVLKNSELSGFSFPPEMGPSSRKPQPHAVRSSN